MIFTTSERYGQFLNCVIEVDNDKPEDELYFSIKSTVEAIHIEEELLKLVKEIAKWRLEKESKE